VVSGHAATRAVSNTATIRTVHAAASAAHVAGVARCVADHAASGAIEALLSSAAHDAAASVAHHAAASAVHVARVAVIILRVARAKTSAVGGVLAVASAASPLTAEGADFASPELGGMQLVMGRKGEHFLGCLREVCV
jgi:hypothetical protein